MIDQSWRFIMSWTILISWLIKVYGLPCLKQYWYNDWSKLIVYHVLNNIDIMIDQGLWFIMSWTTAIASWWIWQCVCYIYWLADISFAFPTQALGLKTAEWHKQARIKRTLVPLLEEEEQCFTMKIFRRNHWAHRIAQGLWQHWRIVTSVFLYLDYFKKLNF